MPWVSPGQGRAWRPGEYESCLERNRGLCEQLLVRSFIPLPSIIDSYLPHFPYEELIANINATEGSQA